MHAIQDNEVVQARELSSFLDLEINFVEQYLNVLKDVKSNWHSGYVQDYPGSIPLIPNNTVTDDLPRHMRLLLEQMDQSTFSNDPIPSTQSGQGVPMVIRVRNQPTRTYGRIPLASHLFARGERQAPVSPLPALHPVRLPGSGRRVFLRMRRKKRTTKRKRGRELRE